MWYAIVSIMDLNDFPDIYTPLVATDLRLVDAYISQSMFNCIYHDYLSELWG